MTEKELNERTKRTALRVIRLVNSLPKNNVGEVLGRQVVRSATSVAANYRAVCKARSRKDFINKIGISEEEADERELWLELIIESNLVMAGRVQDLLKEVSQITAILAASRITARGKK